MKFPFLYRKDRLYPIVPFEIRKGKLVLKTEALVDSGANISGFFEKFIVSFDELHHTLLLKPIKQR